MVRVLCFFALKKDILLVLANPYYFLIYKALEDSATVDATYEIYPYVPPQESQEPVIVTVNAGDAAYKYCNQNLLSMRVFPALPGFQPVNSQWMTVGQEHVTNIYGWTSFGVVAFFFLVLAWRIGKLAFAVMHGGYKVSCLSFFCAFSLQAIISNSQHVPFH